MKKLDVSKHDFTSIRLSLRLKFCIRARITPQAWRCLRILCQLLPESRVVHQLLSAKILPILEKSLGQVSLMFGQLNTDRTTPENEDKSHLGKRKRCEGGDEEASPILNSAFQELLDLFLAVVAFLESLNALSGNDTGHRDVDVQEQFKSVVQGGESQAPDILCNWLLCINHIAQSRAVSTPHRTKSVSWNWIQPILPIWESQKSDASTVR